VLRRHSSDVLVVDGPGGIITAGSNKERIIVMKKLMQVAMATTLGLGVIAASIQPAEARYRGRAVAGFAAGVIGLSVLGAYAHSRDRHYYSGSCYKVGGGCYWKEGHCWYNRYGEQVCRRGYRVCEPSRTVCD
jgi:hypothetical protein